MSEAINERVPLVWEAAIESMEAAALVFDPREDRIHQFNEAALKLFAYSGYELGTMRVSRLFADQLSELTGLTLECLAVGRAWSTTFSVAQASGVAIPVELFASVFKMGARELVLLIAYDLRTMRSRRAEAELDQFYRSGLPQENRVDAVFRQLERGNQLILHAAGEGIYGVDTEGRTTFLNPAAERMLGWRAEELIGRIAHAHMHHSHEDGAGYPIKACPIYAAFRDGRVHRVLDEVFWRKDGTCFPVEYTSTPIQEKGRLLGAVVVFRDVSAQREAQANLIHALEEVEELKQRLELENAYLQDELRSGSGHKEIVGSGPAILNIIRQIDLVAPSDATVLITGESGTGKELIARAIHHASSRSSRPLIRVNCASIPTELFESEFFGHAKGAFTGALHERVGRFELADGGTIFLDEVGELPMEHQAKLLRILQERQFERVGESRTREVDVRVIAATNRDLRSEVTAKCFREDLFFRLNVFPIESPPLRERLDDIPALASLFLERACQRANKPNLQISLADVERLQSYHWPGNIRELENVIERAVITAVDGRLRLHVPTTLQYDPVPGQDQPPERAAPAARQMESLVTEADRLAIEKKAIEDALRLCHGRVSGTDGAAERLGVKPTTLYSRIKRFEIDARLFKSTKR
ncbi:MAG: sigma 54-interacting transcriptional regulator [Hyphomicrobiaceae bacterium]|nr:sigma 54-interacting transcriptional regulator [Hyphomicrobiaceae bacterium]